MIDTYFFELSVILLNVCIFVSMKFGLRYRISLTTYQYVEHIDIHPRKSNMVTLSNIIQFEFPNGLSVATLDEDVIAAMVRMVMVVANIAIDCYDVPNR